MRHRRDGRCIFQPGAGYRGRERENSISTLSAMPRRTPPSQKEPVILIYIAPVRAVIGEVLAVQIRVDLHEPLEEHQRLVTVYLLAGQEPQHGERLQIVGDRLRNQWCTTRRNSTARLSWGCPGGCPATRSRHPGIPCSGTIPSRWGTAPARDGGGPPAARTADTRRSRRRGPGILYGAP